MRLSLFSLLIVLGLTACRSPFNKKEPVFTGDSVAFFQLASATYPVEEIRKELPAQAAYPDLSEDVLSRLLASLIFQRETVWGKTTRRVFYNEQLPDLVLRMREAIRKLDESKRLVVIARHDPDHSVLSHMERTTMLIWVDEAGLNLVLGEIRQELPHNDILERQDWMNILPVSMKRAYNDLSLLPGPYTLKTIRGFTHNTWAVFPLDALESLPPVPAHNRAGDEAKPPSREEKKEDKKEIKEPAEGEPKPAQDAPPAAGEPAEKKEPVPALRDRLTELKQALEQGLITQAEYDEKRKAILEKH